MQALKCIFLFIFLSSPSSALLSQDWQFDYTELADLYNSFEQNNTVITSAVQDKEGFIWLAANEGIFRYDDVSLFPFAQKFNNKIIPYTFIRHQMRIGPNGDIWLVSQLKGILRIQADGHGISTFELPEPGNFSYSDVYFENDSIVWVTTSDSRLHKYHLLLKSWQSYSTDCFDSDTKNLSFGNIVQDLEMPNQFWIGSKNGLFLFDKTTAEFTFYKLENPYVFYTREWPVPLHLFHRKILIGGPANIGIDVFDIVNKSFDTRMGIPPPIVGRGLSYVLSFLNYSDSLVLVGTNDRYKMGSINLNSDGKMEYILRKYDTSEEALKFTRLLIRIKDGSIRAIGNRGITRVYQQKNKFSYYRLTKNIDNKNNWQRSFLQLDDPDKFLLGTYRGDGLIEVDWKNRSHRIIPYLSKKGFHNYDVTMRSLAKDTKGIIWIGSENGLLVCNL
jgi:ligand-binding sensor domain-containing protein